MSGESDAKSVWFGGRELGDAGFAGCDGLAGASRVAGNAAHRHVDPEAGGGAVLLGLAAPEAVLAVLASPAPAGVHDRAGRADRPGPGLPEEAGLGSFPRGCEEQFRLPGARRSAVQVRGPVKSRLETVSTATVSSSWSGKLVREVVRLLGGADPGAGWGEFQPPACTPTTMVTDWFQSVQQTVTMAAILFTDG